MRPTTSSEEIKQSRDRFQLAQQASNIGTFEWNTESGKIIWTTELEALYGLNEGQLGNDYKTWLSHLHPEDQERIDEEVLRSAKKGSDINIEFRVIWPDHSVHFLQAKAKIYRDAKSNPTRVVGVNIDITDQKEQERRKDEFITIASHELKTPVATLKGYNQIIGQQIVKFNDSDLSSYVDKMSQQIDRLALLINSLLDVSKIQENKLELDREKVNIDQLVMDIVEDMQHATDNHRLEIDTQSKTTLMIDRFRISQVLINLISNAIKYSPRADRVIVSTKRENNHVLVQIHDYGVGITKKYQKLIFNRFFQVSSKIRGSFFGLGLGLYISSEIVRRHGGKIWVESVKGEGSTFSFTLPINNA